jgi:hypothetical protein
MKTRLKTKHVRVKGDKEELLINFYLLAFIWSNLSIQYKNLHWANTAKTSPIRIYKYVTQVWRGRFVTVLLFKWLFQCHKKSKSRRTCDVYYDFLKVNIDIYHKVSLRVVFHIGPRSDVLAFGCASGQYSRHRTYN